MNVVQAYTSLSILKKRLIIKRSERMKNNLLIYKDEKSMNIQPTTEYMKSIPRRPSNKIYCPTCNRILCPVTDKCICGQIIEWR